MLVFLPGVFFHHCQITGREEARCLERQVKNWRGQLCFPKPRWTHNENQSQNKTVSNTDNLPSACLTCPHRLFHCMTHSSPAPTEHMN